MNELFQEICRHDRLRAAWEVVRRKGAKGGIDGVQPQDLDNAVERALLRLSQDLEAERYTPLPYAKGAMPKFDEANEWRTLSMPAVVDKIVQQAFVQIVESFFEKEFLDCSYAYRKGKGAVAAIQRVEYILQNHRICWAAALDIDNFFDAINHDLLMKRFTSSITEKPLLKLVGLWLHAGLIGSRGEWDAPDEGIAQGSVLSPLLSNIYLHPMDSLALDRGYLYIRYSDNFILLAESKDVLYIAYEQLRRFLENDLLLRLNDNPYPFKSIEKGFAFLGVYFSGSLRRISSAKETKIFRKINWLTDKFHQRDPEAFLIRLNESVAGTRRHYAFIQPIEQFRAFDEHLIKRLLFLIRYFREKGFLSSPEELRSFVERLPFYAAKSAAEHSSFCNGLIREITRTVTEQPTQTQKNEDALENNADSRAQRQTAKQSQYLRLVANQAEITVSTPGIFIGKTGNRIVMRENRCNVLEIPMSKVKNLSVHTKGISLSSDVVFECAHNAIPITFYNWRGMPCATLQTPMNSMGNISVLQLRAYETEKALTISKCILSGKSHNQVNLLKFYLRSRRSADNAFVRQAEENLPKMVATIQELQNVKMNGAYSVARDRLFAAEGRISALYWNCMKLIVIPELNFTQRVHQKASDIVNCLLNYGYGILYQRVWQAILKEGLNPHVSFLHAFQNNKPTLVYDLVEEYRQAFVDRAIFSLLTKGKKGADLGFDSEGMLNKETKGQTTRAVLNRLSGVMVYKGKKIKSEDVISLQIKNLVLSLKEEVNYRSFVAGY